MHARSRLWLVSLPLLVIGCGSSSGGNGETPDSGPVSDDSSGMDGSPSPIVDSGGTPDTGTVADAEAGAGLMTGALLPTGDSITPTAAPGSDLVALKPGIGAPANFVADHAASTATSPDGKTLLVLTSGYNETNWIPTNAPTPGVIGYEDPANSGEWIFVYDISANKAPAPTQVLKIPNSFSGIAFNPAGTAFYVGGGVNDNVHVFNLTNGTWAEATTTTDAGAVPATIALSHSAGLGLQNGPVTAGLATTADGTKLVVANYENDSISIVTLASGAVVDLDLRPGKAATSPMSGVAGRRVPVLGRREGQLDGVRVEPARPRGRRGRPHGAVGHRAHPGRQAARTR